MEKKPDWQLAENNYYKLLLDDTLAGYWVRNFKDNTGYLSPAFKKMFGYQDEEMLTSIESWEQIIFPEDLDKLYKNFEQHVKSRGEIPHRIEVRYKHKDGSTVWVQAIGRVVEWDQDFNPVRMIGCHIDISKQKKIEEELKISEQQFKGAFQYSSIGMALVSLEGKWIRVNNKICDILGYSNKELLAITFQDLTHPDDLLLDLNLLREVIDRKRNHYQIEKRYFHKNGEIIWVQLNVSIITNDAGDPLHFVSQIQDITKRKQTEANLIALTEKLTTRNKKLGDFAHIASHNLRAPVSNLTTLINMYNQVDELEDREEVYKNFQRVVNHLSSTLNDLIDSLKIQENLDQTRELISFEEVLGKTKEILVAQILETDTVIETDFNEVHSITYHRPYLESIFLNLLSNAIKYRSPDRNPIIKISTGKLGKGVTYLKISDNGIGINLKRHGHKVFGLHKTFHRHKEAKGVGLFMTRAQVEAMGGQISVESIEHEGTTFTILF
ncbi:sensor histidine kinase [Owenweeksia hongkongensis]|uniref:sensor histidine kinase n=1 Tax=Owenweeksia hongkongensis TaxID=253245 RepID=UPI003A8F7C38